MYGNRALRICGAQIDRFASVLKRPDCRFLEFGCGAGLGLSAIAAAHPHMRCTGFDISAHALALAEKNAVAAGSGVADRVTLLNGLSHSLPTEPTFDFILINDVLHDTTRPNAILQKLRRCVRAEGVMCVADIACAPTFAANMEHNPLAGMFYHISTFICLSSALSEPDGLGLGTLGLHEEVGWRR